MHLVLAGTRRESRGSGDGGATLEQFQTQLMLSQALGTTTVLSVSLRDSDNNRARSNQFVVASLNTTKAAQ